jgi:hypothetical protein
MYGGKRRRAFVELTDEMHRELTLGGGGEISDEDARQAWAAHGPALMARCNPGTRPAAFWRFDTTVPAPRYIRAARRLWEHGLLRPDEQAQLEAGWRAEVERAFKIASSAADYHGRLRDVPEALRRAWPGQTAADVAHGEERDVDPRRLRG